MSIIKALFLFAFGVVLCHSAAQTGRLGYLNTYRLYNSDNPDGKIIRPDVAEASIEDKPIVVLVHGYGENHESGFASEVLIGFMYGTNMEKVNVIVLNWSVVASLPYETAMLLVDDVADNLAKAIDNIITNNADAKQENVHLVGYDVGAHVAGIAARKMDNQKIARITGLDPRRNGWGENSARLTVTDAQYVEVIHTDTIGAQALGINEPLGHVDFYPNGGSAQPGCTNNLCSHQRSYELYMASVFDEQNLPSVPSNHLVGNLCYVWSQLTSNTCTSFTLKMGGIKLDKIGSGVFRLTTGRAFPF